MQTALTAEDRYTEQHARAAGLLTQLQGMLADLPAPGTTQIHWGHVGDLSHLCEQLEQIAERFAE